ncbi:MAG: hypothetical protein ABI797_06455, partial [Chloroflexota bacterium]
TLFGVDEEAVETDSPFLLIARNGHGSLVGRASDRAQALEACAAAGDDVGVRRQLTETTLLRQAV